MIARMPAFSAFSVMRLFAGPFWWYLISFYRTAGAAAGTLRPGSVGGRMDIMVPVKQKAIAPLLALVLGSVLSAQQPATEHVTVYRVATCGCCSKWVEHLKANGFSVTEHVIEDRNTAPARERVPEQLRSCHTATVGRYVVEGHVPADVIKDLLRKQPDIEGIAVPGMPAGSPGMESPNPQPYEIIAFDKAGRTSTFARR